MISRLHLSALLSVAAVIGGAILLIDGVAVQLGWLGAIGGTVTVVSLLLLAFERWAWSWRWLSGWFVERPDFRGTWRVRLHSSWAGPGGEAVGDIEAYLVVRQTFSKLSLRMLTAESSSEMVGTSIQRAEDGIYEVTGIYMNRPRLNARDRSPIHYGGLALTIEGDPVTSMTGHYWTDRETRGEMATEGRRKAEMHTFAKAQAAFEEMADGGEMPHSNAEPASS